MQNLKEFQHHFFRKYNNFNKYINRKTLRIFIYSVKIIDNDFDLVESQLLDLKNKEISSLILNNIYSSNTTSKEFIGSTDYYKHLSNLMALNFEQKNLFIDTIEQELKKNKVELKKEIKEKKQFMKDTIKSSEIEKLYPLARRLFRTIICNLGPTNSGKTYTAIQELQEASRGLYLAPLRLLAREVYDDLRSKGIKVSLITGEEQIIDKDATHTCSTVEMANLNKYYDVAVIDEIQFLSDEQRGNAWTRALLGLNAQKVICLGSTDSAYLINELCSKTGDIVTMNFFERLSPIEMIEDDIAINDLKKSDAIITFSRKSVHKIVKLLETKFEMKVSMIYGSLPPEVRLEEARRFNNGETDILVSTDAIGYGLNLNIGRVIFSTVEKFNGEDQETISQSAFKQISGRAGRFGKFEKGEVAFISSFNKLLKRPNSYNDFVRLSKTFGDDLDSQLSAYYFPEWETLQKTISKLKNQQSIKELLDNYKEHFKTKDDLLKIDFSFLEELISLLDEKDLGIEEKYSLVFAPVRPNTEDYFESCVEYIIENKEYISNFPLYLERAKSLEDLEQVSHETLLYMWLHFRYPNTFKAYDEAKDVYDEISISIMEILKEGY